MTEQLMKTAARSVVLADKELRDIFCDTFKQRKQEAQVAAAAEAERQESRAGRLSTSPV